MNDALWLDPSISIRLCLTLLHSLWFVPLLAGSAWLAEKLGRLSVERSYALHAAAIVAALIALPLTYSIVEVAPATQTHDGGAPQQSLIATTIRTDWSAAPINVQPPGQVGIVMDSAETPPATSTQPSLSAVPVADNSQRASSSLHATAWIVGTYALGVLMMLMRLGYGLWRAHRDVVLATRLKDGPLVEHMAALARQCSLRVAPMLATTEQIIVPQVVGLFRPMILLPASAVTGLSPDELRMILAHELAHIHRHDLWLNLLQRLAETVLFFNPALWWLSRRTSTLREFCCDEFACRFLSSSGPRRHSEYAAALLRVAELSRPLAGELATLAAAGRSPSELRRRIARLLGEPIREPLRLSRSSLLVIVAGVALLLGGPALWPSQNESASAEAAVVQDESSEPDRREQVAQTSGEENALAANPSASQADKATEEPADKVVTINGKVLDDATGEPVPRIVIQGGLFDPAKPDEVKWGYSESRSGRRDGSFSTTINWAKGWTARVVAGGYISQPLLTSAPPADQDEIEVVIRLKRGPMVRGVVLDHQGQPVKGAEVMAVGPIAAYLPDSQDYDPALTDADGRFELPVGEAEMLAVSHATLEAWSAEIPAEGNATIRLPEPARVDIELDIEGADEESEIFYQLLTEGRPEFQHVRIERNVKITNPGKLSLSALPPGRYQLCRSVMNRLAQIGKGAMLERQFFELGAGEQKSIQFVRKQGVRVRGKVALPEGTELQGTIVSIRSLLDQKDPSGNHEWPIVYASQTTGEDGSFLTERIPPGKYLLVAEAYRTLTQEEQFRTGIILPSFVAEKTIDVPADGEPLELSIELEGAEAGNK